MLPQPEIEPSSFYDSSESLMNPVKMRLVGQTGPRPDMPNISPNPFLRIIFFLTDSQLSQKEAKPDPQHLPN